MNQVSHELGSPLTNVSLNLDLAMGCLDQDAKQSRGRLEIVVQEVARLNRLVANVLTFSHQERGTLELKREICSPDLIVAQLLESFRPALERRSVIVREDLAADIHIESDPDAITQIVANLISNVEKYAFSGKSLEIVTAYEDGELTISVMDKGPGIPVEAHERIFRAFERVEDGVNEGSSGTGLGLSIASELAAKLGGKLELVESSEGCHVRLSLLCDEVNQETESSIR